MKLAALLGTLQACCWLRATAPGCVPAQQAATSSNKQQPHECCCTVVTPGCYSSRVLSQVASCKQDAARKCHTIDLADVNVALHAANLLCGSSQQWSLMQAPLCIAGCAAKPVRTPANAAAPCCQFLVTLKVHAACVVNSGAAAAAVCSGLPESFSLLPLQGGPARCNTSGW
jgi:hypothetical protein